MSKLKKKKNRGGDGEWKARDTDESSLGFTRGVVKEKTTPSNENALYIHTRILY